MEDLDLGGERVDVLISEPMGTLLVNERMLETYLHARDHFLAPGSRMFPVSALPPRAAPSRTFSCLLSSCPLRSTCELCANTRWQAPCSTAAHDG